MIDHFYCSCGFAAKTHDELFDHLHEVFTLASDIAPDGQQHAEEARDTPGAPLRCTCGYPAVTLDDLDHHILAACTPPHSIGPDGVKHVPESS
jgi:hypothetical protein